MSNVVDKLEKDCFSLSSFKSRASCGQGLQYRYHLGSDPRNRNERVGEVGPWRKKASIGCVTGVAPLDDGVSSTEGHRVLPELSVQVMGSWDVSPVG